MTYRPRLRVASAALIATALAIPAGATIAQEGTTITFLTPPWGVPPDLALLEAFEAESGITVEVDREEPDRGAQPGRPDRLRRGPARRGRHLPDRGRTVEHHRDR